MSCKGVSIRATLSSALVGCALLAAADAHADQTLYQETFPWTGTTTQDLELREQGWCGGNAGDVFCDNPPGTDANEGGEGAISNGAGPDSFAFWSQKGINADSSLYTDEATFNSSDWLRGCSGTVAATRCTWPS